MLSVSLSDGGKFNFVDTKEFRTNVLGFGLTPSRGRSREDLSQQRHIVSYHHTQETKAATMVQLANVDHEKVVNLARRYTNDAENDLLRKLVENRERS